MDNEDSFKKDITINKYKLDEECLSHASRYAYYAEACALAKNDVSKCKDNLELIMAERNLDIREFLAKSEKKVTEAMVSAELAKDESVRQAKADLREAENVFARMNVAVDAMNTRRSELDNLVKLYCAGYFSVVDGDAKKSINNQTSMDIRKNLNK